MFKPAVYKGVTIRTIEEDGNILFCLKDIADGFNINRSKLSTTISKNNISQFFYKEDESIYNLSFLTQFDLVKLLSKINSTTNELLYWITNYNKQENNISTLQPINTTDNPYISMSKLELLEQISVLAQEALYQAKENQKLKSQITDIKKLLN